jgi:hypothetical protein
MKFIGDECSAISQLKECQKRGIESIGLSGASIEEKF